MNMNTVIKTQPIAFSAGMVRSILKGKKTQTRQVIDPQPEGTGYAPILDKDGLWQWHAEDWPWDIPNCMDRVCPYGEPGDRLWVQEQWEPLEFSDLEVGVVYAATPYKGVNKSNLVHWFSVGEAESSKWSGRCGAALPSSVMPRWASRITLEIVGVRVERLCEISDGDTVQEGLSAVHMPPDEEGPLRIGYMMGVDDGKSGLSVEPKDAFQRYWDLHNDLKWDEEPWVWVIDFKMIETTER